MERYEKPGRNSYQEGGRRDPVACKLADSLPTIPSTFFPASLFPLAAVEVARLPATRLLPFLFGWLSRSKASNGNQKKNEKTKKSFPS